MDGKGSRTKGKRGERAVEVLVTERGLTYDRQIDGRVQEACDGILERRFASEVRRRERLALDRWVAEVASKCPDDLDALVIGRSSHRPWVAAMPFSALLDLLTELREARERLSQEGIE